MKKRERERTRELVPADLETCRCCQHCFGLAPSAHRGDRNRCQEINRLFAELMSCNLTWEERGAWYSPTLAWLRVKSATARGGDRSLGLGDGSTCWLMRCGITGGARKTWHPIQHDVPMPQLPKRSGTLFWFLFFFFFEIIYSRGVGCDFFYDPGTTRTTLQIRLHAWCAANGGPVLAVRAK